MMNPPMPPPSLYQNSSAGQYTSAVTPSPRPPRPRFGFHAPSPYPRPRSSASKPNPSSSFNSILEEPVSDNYYPTPDDYSYINPRNENYMQYPSQNSSFSSQDEQNSSYNASYMGSTGDMTYSKPYSYSNYGSSNNSFSSAGDDQSFSLYGSNSKPYARGNKSFSSAGGKKNFAQMKNNKPFLLTGGNSSPVGGNNQSFSSMAVNQSFSPMSGNQSFSSMGGNQSYSPMGGNRSFTSQDGNSSYSTCPESPFTNNADYYNNQPTTYQTNSWGRGKKRGGRRGRIGNTTSRFSPGGQQMMGEEQADSQNFRKGLKRKATAPRLDLRCELCGIDFTSQIPYDMHVQGAKHTKKMKAIETLSLLKSQGLAKPTDTDTSIFRCEICDVSLNGALQLQTHFEGTKHKNKVNPPEAQANKQNGKEEETKPSAASVKVESPAKMQKLSCDVCGVSVNSSFQLTQHLESKKHQRMLEGKPQPVTGRKKKKAGGADGEQMDTTCPKTVGIPDISANFVKADG